MVRALHRQCLTFLSALLAGLIWLGCAGVEPVSAQTLTRQSDVDHLLQSAEKRRAFADERAGQAAEWRELAGQNRKDAETAGSVEDRNGWLREARDKERRAQEIEDEVARERRRADEEEAEARRLQGEVDGEKQRRARERALQDERQRQFDAEQAASREDPAPEKLELEDALGFWRFDDDENPFVIVQEDPDFEAYPYRLEAHTRERVWKGNYEPSEPGEASRQHDARLTFRYKPKAEEMNSEIPAWAREQLEGELEWTVEIDEPRTCGGDHLDFKWYPGEVTWQDGEGGEGGKAWISGKGKARHRTLVPEEFEPPELFAAAMVRLRLPGQGMRAEAADAEKGGVDLGNELPLQALIKGQLFYVEVFLPYELAKEKGANIIVNIRGMSEGGTASRALQRGALRKGYPAKYTNYDPLVIGEGPTFLSQSWFNEVGTRGSRLDFNPKNGESVEFAYEDAKTIVPVYNDVQQFKLAQYFTAVARLRGLFASLLNLPHVTDRARESALRRLLLLSNFEALMAHEERPDWLKVGIAKRYLGYPGEALRLLAGGARLNAIDSKDRDGSKDIDGIDLGGTGLVTMSDDGWAEKIFFLETWGGVSVDGMKRMFWNHPLTDEQRVGDNDKAGRFNGVVWTSNFERATTMWLLDDLWQQKVRAAFNHFRVNLVKGLYDWTLSVAEVGFGNFKIGVGDLYTVLSGTDPYGRKVTKGRKLEIISHAFFSSLLDYSKSKFYRQAAGSQLGYLAPGDRAMTVSDAAQALRGRVIQSHKYKPEPAEGKSPPPEFPESVAKNQKEAAVPILSEQGKIDNRAHRASCAEATTQPVPRANLPPILDGSGLPRHEVGDLAAVQARFGAEASYDPSQPRLGQPQQFQTCNIDAVAIGLKEEMGVDYTPVGALRKLAENDAFEGRLRNVDKEQHPFIRGYDEDLAVRFAHLEGAETLQLPNGQKLTARALENWRERGWRVKIVVHARDHSESGDNLHAVDFTGVKRGEDGCVLAVTVTDPGFQRRIDMPWDNLKDRLADYPVLLYRPAKGVAPARSGGDAAASGSGTPRTGPDGGDAGSGGTRPRPKVEEFDPTAGADDGLDASYRAQWQQRGESPDAAVRRLEAKRDRSVNDEVELHSARMALRARREVEQRGEVLRELRARQAAAEDFDFSRQSRQPPPQENVMDTRNPRRQVVENDVDYIERIMQGTGIKPTQNQVWASTINKYAQEFLNGVVSESRNKYDVELVYRDGPRNATAQEVATAPASYTVSVGGSGHHRLIAAAIVGRLTGRPIFGGDEAIIP